jgi:hypothetical protein
LNKHVYRHRTGRNRLQSMSAYWRYVYYRYCLEMENSAPDAANAVVEGVYDSLCGRFGPLGKPRRRFAPLLKSAFETVRQWKIPKKASVSFSA